VFNNISQLSLIKKSSVRVQSVLRMAKYDGNGNIIGRKENTETELFTYDSLNRIQTSTQKNETYTYDQRGNRQTLASDQLPNVEASDYTYDERNRLAKVVKQDGTVVTYKYNGEGLLTERTENGVTTRYYYDGSNIIGEGIVNAD
jgi:YD repeat-containing protein